LERLARDKHSRFLRKYVNYGRKKFIGLGSEFMRGFWIEDLGFLIDVRTVNIGHIYRMSVALTSLD
jgi:hypothetical protein